MLSNLICIVFNKALLPSLGMWPGRNPDRTLNKLSNPERTTCWNSKAYYSQWLEQEDFFSNSFCG